ncbi:MAG: hypothetical protein KF893_16455 [Caldilineaceae bacterium]|nr:hypothetical protein [Caldilineaceae bacterium]
MSISGELIELQIEETDNTEFLNRLQHKLLPGTLLIVENWANEKISLRIVETALKTVESEALAGLIEQDGLLVYRGEPPQGFDWEAFLQEEREAPLHPYEPDPRCNSCSTPR